MTISSEPRSTAALKTDLTTTPATAYRRHLPMTILEQNYMPIEAHFMNKAKSIDVVRGRPRIVKDGRKRKPFSLEIEWNAYYATIRLPITTSPGRDSKHRRGGGTELKGLAKTALPTGGHSQSWRSCRGENRFDYNAGRKFNRRRTKRLRFRRRGVQKIVATSGCGRLKSERGLIGVEESGTKGCKGATSGTELEERPTEWEVWRGGIKRQGVYVVQRTGSSQT